MRTRLIAIFCTSLAMIPAEVSAHAFGQKYTLPLPVWLYVFGGGATIIASFVLIGYFSTQANPHILRQSIDLSRWKLFFILTTPASVTTARIAGLLLFILTLTTGIFGTQIPTLNFAPTFFWLIFLLGFTYLTALVGNLWDVMNPWKTLTAWVLDNKPFFSYPKRLGYSPALIFYFCLIWLELLSGGAAVRPENLSVYLADYTTLTLAGVALFGSTAWFKYGDFFSVFFGLISRLAPITYRNGKLMLRWPFVGLLEESAERMSLLLFIVFMLSSTAFDGFRETIKAAQIVVALSFLHSNQLIQLVMLFGVFILFISVYAAGIWGMKAIIKSPLSIIELSLLFAFSLVPIALAYNLAHYFTLLLVQGQSIIFAASDPLNLGWNIFGTRDYTVNIAIVGAKTVWQSQVMFILAGHIAAIYVAHILALRTFNAHRHTIMSQLPMLLVMVAYTMTGLWILSQPLTLGT